MEPTRTIGVVGLGRMGGGLALQARDKGLRVVGYDRGPKRADLISAGVELVDGPRALRERLPTPRVVFVYVPAGKPVDEVVAVLAGELERGDLIVDGGNSYWRDSKLRAQALAEAGLRFCDLGTSGGVEGARHGACFMLGGEDDAVALIEPILSALAVPGGYVHAGGAGAGHYTKLVHNGIEFGMLQAIGEGVELLDAYEAPLHVADVLRCFRDGSVIRSWLIDLMEQAYRAEQPDIDEVPPYVEDTGEVNWLVEDALRMEVPIPVITQSVMQLLASRDTRRIAPRAVAMMRHGFGGHPYGEDEAIRRERQKGRMGDVDGVGVGVRMPGKEPA